MAYTGSFNPIKDVFGGVSGALLRADEVNRLMIQGAK